MNLIKATVLLVASILLTNHVATAEIKTFTKEYSYEAGELDSKVTSRYNALEQVKRILLEELGVFLTSQTEVLNSKLTKDQITSITAGIVSAVVIDEKWDGHKYWLKAKIDADPTVVQQAIEIIRSDIKKTTDLEQAQKRIEQLTKDLEAVKLDLASNPQERQKRYTKIVNQKQSVDWIVKFFNLFNEKKSLAENRDALEAINKAITLDPEFLVPYVMRAALYGEVAKDYQRAVEDMTTAIIYFTPGPNNPYENTAMLYEGRGRYYLRQNKLNQAAGDFVTALEVDPDGILMPSSMFTRADIELFIRKQPKDYRSYILRARFNSHFISGSDNSNNLEKRYKVYNSAITDIQKAIKMGNKSPVAYYLLTEAFRYKARWYESAHYNEIDMASHNAMVDAATKGLKLSSSSEWKNRFLSIRAEEYLTLKQYQKAVADYDSRLDLYPNYAGTYHDRAIAHKELGEFDLAISDLTKAISMKHNSLDWPRSAYEVRAHVYEAMGKYKEAVEDYSSAFNIWEKVFGAYHKENKVGSSIAFDILEKRANARRKIKDFTKAIEDYRLTMEWIGNQPPLPMVYEEIGDTYMEMDKPEEAIAEYDKAIARNIETNKDNMRNSGDVMASSYYVKKAQAYGMLEKADKAIENYKLAIETIADLPPLQEEIYRDMGTLYQGIGIKPEALKCYRKAVVAGEFRGVPDFVSYSQLASLELESGNRTEAFLAYNKLVRAYPKIDWSYMARGKANLSVGNYWEAIEDFNKAADITPTNSHAYLYRAEARFRLEQNDKGFDDLRISARLGNKDAQATLREYQFDW